MIWIIKLKNVLIQNIIKNIKNNNLEKVKSLFKTIEFLHLIFYLDNNKEIRNKNINFLLEMGVDKKEIKHLVNKFFNKID